VRGLGSESIDFRTRHADFANVAPEGRARWLGMPIAELSRLDRALVVGSFLRKDHPLLAPGCAARHAAAHRCTA
jgi:NADH-quinone oxidoreductase subunit G